MARFSAILLFAWSLLLGPALCMGGMLDHDCPCDVEAQCEHEDTCADDPCETLSRPDTLDAEAWLDLGRTFWQLPLAVTPVTTALRKHTGKWSTAPPPEQSRWPFVASNRPLLI
jgi:hypothetical protein